MNIDPAKLSLRDPLPGYEKLGRIRIALLRIMPP